MAAQTALPQLVGKRILIVDDNATNREIVVRHVRSWGMEAMADRASPSEALTLIENGENFDVAVLDLLMPEMDGLALAREIRCIETSRELPLVLITSLAPAPAAQSSGDFAVQVAKPAQGLPALQRPRESARRAHPPAGGGGPTPEVGKPASRRCGILLAEDNAVNQKVALRILDQLGYRADVASDGLEALEALERQPYDVVLMDVQMPEHRRSRCFAPDLRALAGRRPPAHHRDDRERDARGPRGLLRRRDG